MQVKCPTCKKLNEYEGNEFRPFCSKRCKLIDLGEWASGSYAIPVEEKPQFGPHPDSEDSEEV